MAYLKEHKSKKKFCGCQIFSAPLLRGAGWGGGNLIFRPPQKNLIMKFFECRFFIILKVWGPTCINLVLDIWKLGMPGPSKVLIGHFSNTQTNLVTEFPFVFGHKFGFSRRLGRRI